MAKGTTKKSKTGAKPMRPRARPTSAPSTSTRPRGRPVDLTPNAERGDDTRPPKKKMSGGAMKPKKKMGGGAMKTKKYAKGGTARGMGAAKKGGKYSRSG